MRDRVPEDKGIAGRWPDEAHEHADRRRLARAVRSDKAHDTAARDPERQSVDGQGAAVALGEAADLYGR